MSNFKGEQLVRLHDLNNAAYNGKLALVKAILSPDGRHCLELLQDGVNPPVALVPAGKYVRIKPENMMHACHQCHQAIVGQLLQCSRCRIAVYCDAKCQCNDWGRHKGQCERCWVTVVSKNKTPFLFRLPRAWLVGLLSEWLTITEVGVLDTAMTMKKHREEFLQCVKEMRSNSVENYEYALSSGSLSSFWSYESYGYVNIKEDRIAKDKSRLQWMYLRQIFIQSLILNGKADDNIQFPSLLKLKCTKEENLFHFLSICSELRSVELSRLISVTTSFLCQIAQLCPHLEEFATGTQLIRRHYDDNDDKRYGLPPTADDIISFLRTCSRLKNVSFSYRTLSRCTDADLIRLGEEFGHLIVGLDADCADYENDEITNSIYSPRGLAHLIGACPRLQMLELNTSDDVDQIPIILSKSQSCQSLTKLTINEGRISNATLQSISQQCKALSFLELVCCLIVGPPSAFSYLGSLEHLQYLHIGPTDGLQDACIAALAVGGVKLKRLNIHDENTNHLFTGEGFASFVGTPIALSLEDIHISAESMTKQGELALGKGLAACTKLRKIAFGCIGMCLGDRGISELCKGCPQLEEINVNFGESMGSCCHILSIFGVSQLVHTYATTLKRVVLSIIPTEAICVKEGLTVVNVALLQAKYPHMRIEIDEN